MVDAPWTAVYDTPNKSVRQGVARRGVVLHHAAMTSLSGLRDMEVRGTKQVSSTAICKDGQIELIVPDDRYRPWSLSDAYWDSAMRSVETCNESVDGWTISDASHWSLAKAVAYWAEKDGFWPHRDGDPSTWTVIGHREVYSIHGGSYGTACPGKMDINLVVRRAQQILNGETEKPKKKVEREMELIRRKTGGMISLIGPNSYWEFDSTPVGGGEGEARLMASILEEPWPPRTLENYEFDILRQNALNRMNVFQDQVAAKVAKTLGK